jgi:hypothetical protein
MEIVAAERLNKIGKSPSIVSTRADFEDDIHTVNELLLQSSAVNSSGSEESLNGYNSGAGGGDVTREDEETDQWAQRKKRGSSKRSISRLLSFTKARINGSHDASCRSQQQQGSPEDRSGGGACKRTTDDRQQLAAPATIPLQTTLRSPSLCRHRPGSFVHQSGVTGQGQGQPPDAV